MSNGLITGLVFFPRLLMFYTMKYWIFLCLNCNALKRSRLLSIMMPRMKLVLSMVAYTLLVFILLTKFLSVQVMIIRLPKHSTVADVINDLKSKVKQ